jgi:hypothetical protein
MKRLLLLLCLPAMLQTKKSFGQDTTSTLSVVVSPALLIPVTVAGQGGFQLRLGKRWSLLAEAAFPLYHPEDETYEKITYQRAGLELKFYLPKRKFTRYIALQNSYLFRELTNKEDGTYYTKTQTFAYTNAVINSPVFATALKIGLELPVGKRSYFDLFTGAGIRTIFTSYKTETALVTSIEPNKQTILKFDDAWVYNYTLMRIHLTAGLRFGFRL